MVARQKRRRNEKEFFVKKNLIGIIALMTIIGVSMTGCDSSTDSRDDGPIITITGIPSRYHGEWADLELENRRTSDWDWAEAIISGSSTAFWFENIVPGVYDVIFHICGDHECVDYFLPSRNITAGIRIPFSQFTLAPWNFYENLERSEQRPPNRSCRRR